MKLRIKGNSLRLRLTQTEIANFGEQGIIEEKTEFPNGSYLRSSIERKKGIKELEAEFSGNSLTVFVPESIAHEWTTTDRVGFENKMDLGTGNTLFLLIEKDWVCLDNSVEDQKDNFPNPNAVC